VFGSAHFVHVFDMIRRGKPDYIMKDEQYNNITKNKQSFTRIKNGDMHLTLVPFLRIKKAFSFFIYQLKLLFNK